MGVYTSKLGCIFPFLWHRVQLKVFFCKIMHVFTCSHLTFNIDHVTVQCGYNFPRYISDDFDFSCRRKQLRG